MSMGLALTIYYALGVITSIVLALFPLRVLEYHGKNRWCGGAFTVLGVGGVMGWGAILEKGAEGAGLPAELLLLAVIGIILTAAIRGEQLARDDVKTKGDRPDE